MMKDEKKALTDYKQRLRVTILDAALQLFTQNGVKAVKMDDVAAKLGISKRTLYELYDTKEALLYESIQASHNRRQEELKQASKKCQNVIEILIAVSRMKVVAFRNVNPKFFSDLVKYPKVARLLSQENQRVRKNIVKFIERGVYEGYFVEDINIDLTSRLFDALNRYVMVNQLYRQFSIEEILTTLLFASVRGICTEKGVRILDRALPL